MKKIYTLTLDDEIPLSDSVSSDIKEIAYYLFGEIEKFEKKILVVDDEKSSLIRNELLENYCCGRYNYRFESEISKTSNYYYEPFLLSNKTFGFTVYDEAISEEEILSLLDGVLKLLHMNYKFNIDSIYYDDDIINGRLSAFNYLMNDYLNAREEVGSQAKKKVKLLSNSFFSFL